MEQQVTHGIDDHSIRALAHELRTPLTSLLGYAQLLQRDDRIGDPRLVRGGLSLIEGRAAQLAQIVARHAVERAWMDGRHAVELASQERRHVQEDRRS
jgi:signal transduction histidine kinase